MTFRQGVEAAAKVADDVAAQAKKNADHCDNSETAHIDLFDREAETAEKIAASIRAIPEPEQGERNAKDAEIAAAQTRAEAWSLTAKVFETANRAYDAVAAGKSIDPSIIRDAVNRLNESRSFAPPCITLYEMEQAFELVREVMVANTKRAEAAERRVAELEGTLQECETYFDERSDVKDGDYGIPEPNLEMSLLQEVRAALAKVQP